MRYSVMIDGRERLLTVEPDAPGRPRVSLDDTPLAVEVLTLAPGHLSVLLGERSFDVFISPLEAGDDPSAQRYEVLLGGVPQVVELVDERQRALRSVVRRGGAGGGATLKAPMPGLVVNVLVAPGDVVERGQRVVILEAMKMQNDLLAPKAGIIRAVKTESGQAVTQGQALIVIGDLNATSPADVLS